MKTITVFGGSLPKPGSPPYQDAQRLGAMLAGSGFAVQTGGYIGTMEATSRGAAEAGGHVIGVTCDEIENWRPVGPNPWVMQEKRCETLRTRLYVLIDECDGAIALPGGIGTLTEILITWAELQIRPEDPRPLILVGNAWQETISVFQSSQQEYIPPRDQARIQLVPDVDAAFDVLTRSKL